MPFWQSVSAMAAMLGQKAEGPQEGSDVKLDADALNAFYRPMGEKLGTTSTARKRHRAAS